MLDDAVNNDLRIVRNAQGCLVYDRPLAAHGLTGMPERQLWLSLYQRLDRSLGDNEAERRILRTYARRYSRLGAGTAAPIPQVCLHDDPYTAANRRTRPDWHTRGASAPR